MDSKDVRILRDKSVRNHGWKYETQVMILLASHWDNDKSIKDFWIITSPDKVKHFDDIVAVLMKADDSKYVFMGQIKHPENINKKMNFKFDDKKTKKQPQDEPTFDIALHKYLESYRCISTKADTNDDLKRILKDVPERNYYYFLYTPMKATGELSEMPMREDDPLKHLDVNSSGYYQWTRQVPQNYELFFQNMYFITGQNNCTAMYNVLQENIPGDRFTDPMIDTLCDFIDDYMSDSDYCSPLTKTTFWKKCVEVRLSQGMRVDPIEVRLQDDYFKLWDEIFLNYNVIKMDNIESVLSLLYSYFEYKIKKLDTSFDWNHCITNRLKVNIEINSQSNKKKQFHHLLDLLRFMGNRREIPWIIDKKDEQLFYEFKDGISNGLFLITFNVAEGCTLPEGTKILQSAHNLKKNPQIFGKIEAIVVSLQGKSPCTLKDIIGGSHNLLRAVHPVHLLKWSSRSKQYNVIGNKLANLDEDYIIRNFTIGDFPNKKCLTEEQLIENLKNHVLTVISSNPGMGKSTTLKSLTLKTHPTNYVICSNLANAMMDFESENPDLHNNPLDYFFSKSEAGQMDHLVRTIFKTHKDSNRITILIDSYDEMLPLYWEKVLDILSAVLKFNIRVVITTRDHALPLLKTRFPNMDLIYMEEISDTDINSYCMKHNIPRQWQHSFKIPLHLHMIKSVPYSTKYIDKCELYQHFISKKFDIHFDKNAIRKNYQEYEIENCFHMHMQIALFHMLREDEKVKGDLICDQDWVKIVKFRKQYNAIGIVSLSENNQIHFAHQTYAEYLLAKWIFENRRSGELFILKKSYYYEQTLKFLVAMNMPEKINVWNSTFLCKSFLDKNKGILKEDEWKILPLDWAAMNSYYYKENAYVFECLLYCTLDAVSDAKDFIEKRHTQNYPDHLSSRFWLKYACDIKSDHLLQNLLQTYQVNPNLEVDLNNKTGLLHYCCANQYESKVKILLDNSANPNQQDIESRTGLYLACLNENKNIVQLLLSNKANPDLVSSLGMALLRRMRHPINFLRLPMLVDYREPGNNRTTSLHLACYKRNKIIVELLLAHKADPNLPDRAGKNSLHHACLKKDNLDVVQLLLKRKLDPNRPSNDGTTSLHLACLVRDVRLVQLLLTNNADPTCTDMGGQNSLHHACHSNNNLEIVQLLLERKLDPDQPDNTGKTSLHLACSMGNKDVVQLLLRSKANPKLTDKEGKNSLHHACYNKDNLDTIQLLLQHQLNPNKKTNDGVTGLHLACMKGNINMVRLLLNNNGDPKLVDNKGMNSLHYACSSKHSLDTVQVLLTHQLNSNEKNNDGTTALHLACTEENIDTIQLLLDNNADPNLVDSNGMNSFDKVSLNGNNLNIIQLLLQYKFNPNLPKKNGCTSLHFACCEGNKDVVDLLLAYEVNPTLVDDYDMNCLHVACYGKKANIVRTLLKHNMNPNQPMYKGNTALHLICCVANVHPYSYKYQNNSDDFKENLESILNVTEVPINDDMIYSKHIEVIKILLEYGADLGLRRNDGLTCFDIASRKRQQDILDTFSSYVQQQL